jgi:hypothetical protein
MRVRIIYGKLRPGTWDEYEQAYKDVMNQAGEIPGLRARWLTRDVDRATWTIPTPDIPSVFGKTRPRCAPTRAATS